MSHDHATALQAGRQSETPFKNKEKKKETNIKFCPGLLIPWNVNVKQLYIGCLPNIGHIEVPQISAKEDELGAQ